MNLDDPRVPYLASFYHVTIWDIKGRIASGFTIDTVMGRTILIPPPPPMPKEKPRD